ncbi:MAG: hypothetical protein JXA51_06005 [Dehalococcoidales bacterium]|nr:hypothetical protein [Dehalococcoidales bacterium]
MQWELILALVIAVPIVLFPIAYVWYINIGNFVIAVKRAREKRSIRKNTPEQEMEYNAALAEAIKRFPGIND